MRVKELPIDNTSFNVGATQVHAAAVFRAPVQLFSQRTFTRQDVLSKALIFILQG